MKIFLKIVATSNTRTRSMTNPTPSPISPIPIPAPSAQTSISFDQIPTSETPSIYSLRLDSLELNGYEKPTTSTSSLPDSSFIEKIRNNAAVAVPDISIDIDIIKRLSRHIASTSTAPDLTDAKITKIFNTMLYIESLIIKTELPKEDLFFAASSIITAATKSLIAARNRHCDHFDLLFDSTGEFTDIHTKMHLKELQTIITFLIEKKIPQNELYKLGFEFLSDMYDENILNYFAEPQFIETLDMVECLFIFKKLFHYIEDLCSNTHLLQQYPDSAKRAPVAQKILDVFLQLHTQISKLIDQEQAEVYATQKIQIETKFSGVTSKLPQFIHDRLILYAQTHLLAHNCALPKLLKQYFQRKGVSLDASAHNATEVSVDSA